MRRMTAQASRSQFSSFNTMGMYESLPHINMWNVDSYEGNISQDSGLLIISAKADASLNGKSENTCLKPVELSEDNQASLSISEKMQRRQMHNREAARRSRQRKKAYVQKLETSRLKLAQVQQELDRARQQGLLISRASAVTGFYGTLNSGIAAFEVEYRHWIDEQEHKLRDLRNVLQLPVSEIELQIIVQNVLDHYCSLFRMKKNAAKADAFHLVYGAWKTPIERFFFWIGGFKPSSVIHVVMPQLESLTEQQVAKVGTLRHSCIQAEDALSLGIEKLQQTMAQSVTNLVTGNENYCSQMASTLEKLESLENFVNQADHLREQILLQISRILTPRQAAQGLLAFGEYFQRMRALSSLWSARPLEPVQPPTALCNRQHQLGSNAEFMQQ